MESSSRRLLSLVVNGMTVAACGISLIACCPEALAQTSQGSSSGEYRALVGDDLPGGSGLAPAPSPQYGGGTQQGYPTYQGKLSHLAVEAGGGFTAPVGDSSNSMTYGWNFRGGLGWNFSKQFGMLGEYEFDRNGIPNNILEEVGEPGGNVHTWSLTLDPIFYYKSSGKWGGYVTGGGGFYRKLTAFTQPVTAIGTYCDFFYCYPYYYTINVVVSHYSSNQGGLNIGTGLTFGEWSRAKFFAEARYEWLDTPGRSTQLVPVTFGIRW